MTHINLNEISVKAHENAKAKGFYDGQVNVGENMMRIVSELGEAFDAHRKRRNANLDMFYKCQENATWISAFEEYVKDTIGDELADVAIYLCDFCGYKGITILGPEQPEIIQNINFGASLLALTEEVCIIESMAILEANRATLIETICNCFSMLFSIAKSMGIDLPTHITLKMKYNETRPAKHGKEY